MKKKLFLILGMALIFGCQENNGNKKATDDCVKLNDSAMDMVIEDNFSKALKLINSAIECDPNNNLFIRNKGMILLNGGFYQECINYLEKHSKQFAPTERLSSLAVCYFHLNDPVMFDSLKREVLSQAEQKFSNAKNESNLIAYLTILKMFDGEKRMIETLNTNKDLFTRADMYLHASESLKKNSTLKMER